MKKKDDWYPDLISRLAELKSVPPRDPHTAANGRARYLADVAKTLPPVSPAGVKRHKDWSVFSGKEQYAMKAVISIVVALVMLVGGGVTVAAAQDDLPDQALYPVKTLTEDVRLWLNTDPTTEVDILMDLVATRVRELNDMVALGKTPPAGVTSRMEKHIQQAIHTAARMDGEAMQGALIQIHTNLRLQQQVMQVLQIQAGGDADHIMTQATLMMENRIRMVETGITDPQCFQNTVRQEAESHAGQEGTSPHENQFSGTDIPGGSGAQGEGSSFGAYGTPQGSGTPRCLLYATMAPQGPQGQQGQKGPGASQGSAGVGYPQCLIYEGTEIPFEYQFQGYGGTPQP